VASVILGVDLLHDQGLVLDFTTSVCQGLKSSKPQPDLLLVNGILESVNETWNKICAVLPASVK